MPRHSRWNGIRSISSTAPTLPKTGGVRYIGSVPGGDADGGLSQRLAEHVPYRHRTDALRRRGPYSLPKYVAVSGVSGVFGTRRVPRASRERARGSSLVVHPASRPLRQSTSTTSPGLRGVGTLQSGSRQRWFVTCGRLRDRAGTRRPRGRLRAVWPVHDHAARSDGQRMPQRHTPPYPLALARRVC